jgi:hypothetical protein
MRASGYPTCAALGSWREIDTVVLGVNAEANSAATPVALSSAAH